MFNKISSTRKRARVRGFENTLDRIYDQINQSLPVFHQEKNSTSSDSTTSEIAYDETSFASSSSTSSQDSTTSENSSRFSISTSSYESQQELDTVLATHQDLVNIAESHNDIYGLSLVISQVFSECNLNESAQKRIFELIKIVSKCNVNIMEYFRFKNVLNSLSTITTYKFLFCFQQQEIVDFPARSRCCTGAHGEIVVFNFLDTVKNIVNNNYQYLSCSQIQETIDLTKTRLYKEIWQDPVRINETLRITLLVNIDDAQMIKSSRASTTPVPFTVAELPSYHRIKKNNIFNLGIYHGEKACSPDVIWQKVLVEPFMALGIISSNVQQEISYTDNPISVDTKYGCIQVLVRIGCVIMDSVAKAKNLNIKSFMGYYGCPYCLIQGMRLVNEEQRSAVFVYPYESDSFYPLKTSHFYDEAAELAEFQGRPHQGVKGKNILASFLAVPDAIPIDYMHNILEGVFKFLLSLKPFKTTRVCQALDGKVAKIKLPHDISRKFRKISEISYWKASECRTFLFHLIPLFRELIDDDSFMLLHCLSTFTRIFSIPRSQITRQEFDQGTQLIDWFLSSFQEIYGQEKMRFNLHLLCHIPKQYSKMGSLIDVSAFCFENNVFRLKRSFHGTRGHIDQMAKSYVLEKGMNNYKNDIDQWLTRFDPDKKLSINYSEERKSFEHVGAQDPDHVINADFLSGIASNIRRETIKCYHSFRVNHVVYHSINYKYNRSSCSWAIAYEENSLNYGQVLAFFTANDLGYNLKSFALIKQYKIMERPNLVKNLKPNQRSLKRACLLSSCNETYKLLLLTDKILTINCNKIQSKLVLIPYQENYVKVWASKIDTQFDHD